MNRVDHGKARAGLITGTCAYTIMHGTQKSWRTLSDNLWADDGSQFAVTVRSGPRAYGHAQEVTARGLLWEEFPYHDIEPCGFVPCHRGDPRLRSISRYLGVSPDGALYTSQNMPMMVKRTLDHYAEIKSPTSPEQYESYKRYVDLDEVPPAHEDQVQHGILVSGVKEWIFATHYQGMRCWCRVQEDDEWQARYLPRLCAFIRFYTEGKKPTRLRAASLLAKL